MAAGCEFFAVLILSPLLATSSYSENAEDAVVWNEESPNRFGIADPTVEILAVNTTSKISFRYKTKQGDEMFVMDKLINRSILENFKHYLHADLHGWRFNLHEPYEAGTEEPGDNIPWINELDCYEFGKSLTGRILQKAVMDVAKTDVVFYPYRVRGKLLRRGDYTTLHTDAPGDHSEYSVIMFLNKRWRRNDYGELYLYDTEHEIVAGAVPKFGRVVIWPSSTPYLARPPSIAFKKGQILLHVQFTESRDKMLQASTVSLAYKKECNELYKAGLFNSPTLPLPQLDVASHVTAHHKSTEGRNILVFDGLFTKVDLDRLRAIILKYGTYFYDDSDDDNQSDNVQWIAGFDVDDFIKSSIWNHTHQAIKFASGGDPAWFPYDVSCNLIRSADHTRIHEDCYFDETEWTFLIYLTPNWTKNDYGETVFYERNGDDTEIISEVRPRYGRAVLFEGQIPHSARPPSTNQTHARLSFAVKMSINEVVARTKAFNEEMRHFVGVKMVTQHLKSLNTTHDDGDQNDEAPNATGRTDQQEEDDEGEGEGEEDANEGEDGDHSNDGHRTKPDQAREDDEAEFENDPEISALNEELNEVLEDPNKTIVDVRAVVQELSARHQIKRQQLVNRISGLI